MKCMRRRQGAHTHCTTLPPPLQSKEKPTTTTTESWKPFLSIPFTLYYDTHTFPPPFILPCATPRTTTKKGIRHPSSVVIVSKRTKSMKRGRRLCQWTIESEHTHILNFAQKVTKIRFRNRIDFRRLFLIRPLLLRFRRSFACEEVQGRISPTRRAGYRGCSSSSSSSRKEKQKKRRKQF